MDLDEVRQFTWVWLISYNVERSHYALVGLPLAIFSE